MGPTVMVMPGPGKSFDAFQADQATCKVYAGDQVKGQADAANQRAVGAAVLTTALGVGLGAAVGSAGGNVGSGAAICEEVEADSFSADLGVVGRVTVGTIDSDHAELCAHRFEHVLAEKDRVVNEGLLGACNAEFLV